MLIPSIDLMGGRIVQLVQGEKLKLAFDDFEYWIDRFASYPIVQLIDLDAAMRQGDNTLLVEKIAQRLHCQVGGGISTLERAQTLLGGGARRVILGSRLFDTSDASSSAGCPVDLGFAEEMSSAIGPEKLVASVDTKQGKVAVKGWKQVVDLTPDQAIKLLEPFFGTFLYTHIEKEGTMQGFPFEVAARLRQATSQRLIVAGGIREQQEVDALDRIGVDAVAGMAVYSGLLAT